MSRLYSPRLSESVSRSSAAAEGIVTSILPTAALVGVGDFHRDDVLRALNPSLVGSRIFTGNPQAVGRTLSANDPGLAPEEIKRRLVISGMSFVASRRRIENLPTRQDHYDHGRGIRPMNRSPAQRSNHL
jgi:hypothetical protein